MIDRRTRRVVVDGRRGRAHAEGVRPPRVPRRGRRRGAAAVSRCSRRCGTRTGTARRRRSTCTSRRCARSSVTRGWIETVRGVGFRSAGARRDVDAVKRRLLVSYLSITAFVLLVLEIPLGVSYSNSVERRLTSDLQHDAFALAIRAQELARHRRDRHRVARTSSSELAAGYRRDAGGRVVIVDRDGRRDRRLRPRRRTAPAARLRDASRDRRAALTGAEVERHRARRARSTTSSSTSRCRSARRTASRARCASPTRRRWSTTASSTSGCCSRPPAASCSASCSWPACCSRVR